MLNCDKSKKGNVVAVVSALSHQAPFLPSIGMHPTAALGAGMVIQLLGYRYYVAKLPGAGT